ncbi:MAG: glutamine--fructose-6-phosphate transaminase (isomerizing) [Kangiellaceae bacterium]|nr:glutamine--fructose-6-phosphate transaminase (isomerizing) [Kangiellaceae bacterium]
MCGVYGYLGQNSSLGEVVEGLKKMEYRGYDSWGMAFPLEDKIETFKSLDSLQSTNSEQFDLSVEFALGHTRWATHGAVNLTNCHPHSSLCGRFALVHNGVVENFQQLKSELIEQGIGFSSDTDSEVILRLLEKQLTQQASRSYRKALSSVFKQLKGHNTLVVIAVDKQLLLGIRNGSPLVAGRTGKDVFLASDCNAFASQTRDCLLLEEKQMIICEAQQVCLYDLELDSYVDCNWQVLDNEIEMPDKQDFPHFMLKEISEQWRTVTQATQVDTELMEELVASIRKPNHVYITGAGAAYFIGEQIGWMLRNLAKVKVTCVPAYESQDYLPHMQQGDVLLAISQSGETADTLRFIQSAKQQGILIASVVNMQGAMMSRLSDFAFYSYAGPEICVLSTKSGTSQLVFGYLLAAQFENRLTQAKAEIERLPSILSRYLDQDSQQDFIEIADSIKGEHLYLLGRGEYLAAAKIGALNIKEASYVHAEAFSAGELKHGVIALIEKGTPVICFADDKNQDYMTAIASEVKARGAYVIGIGESNNVAFDKWINLPSLESNLSIVSNIIPCQLLAYFLAVSKEIDPDRPRNLAKSVTVI